MGVNYALMFTLLRAGAHEKYVRISTNDLANTLGVSQQTTSRWLINFERDGFIERTRMGIRLTQKSMTKLRSIKEFLNASLDAKKLLKLSGTVISGMKDGKYYLQLLDYRRQFKEKLGFIPFPGTLNVKIEDMGTKLILTDRKGINVKGFTHQGRFLGDIKCFPCRIMDRLKAFVILPSRSHYGLDVLEVVSSKNIRKTLNLEDGDKIDFQIRLD